MAGRICCCGCSLRDGTRIIAALYIFKALCLLCVFISYVDVLIDHPAINSNVLATLPDLGYRSSPQQFWQISLNYYRPPLLGFFSVGIILALVQLILTGLLLHGAQKDLESRCRPWYIYNVVRLVFIIACHIGLVVFLITTLGVLGLALGGTLLLAAAIPLGIQAWLVNFVRQYMLELREGEGLAGGCVCSAANANRDKIGTVGASQPDPALSVM